MLFAALVNLSLLAVALSSAVTPSDEDKKVFDAWKLKHGKAYSRPSDELRSFRTWLGNRELVESVNANPASFSWKAALNQFADLTAEEFRAQVLLPSLANGTQLNWKRAPPLNTLQAPPESFDWRTDSKVSAVTPVRNQGSVGSCWAFSTVQNVEGQWALAGNGLQPLSAEFLVDCDGTSDTTLNHADCGVFGGWPYLAYQFIIQTGGLPSEEAWPYCAGTGDCYPCLQGPISLCGPPPYYCDREIDAKCRAGIDAAAKISSWTALTSDEGQLVTELYSRGPLSVLLDATQLQFYSSGIWDGHVSATSAALGCHSSSLNHAVLMVGYGKENDTPFWTVKNSWGEGWGEQGYFRITRGEGKCGINTGVTTAIV